MRGLIEAEVLKLRKRALPWVLLACTVIVIAALYALMAAAVAGGDASNDNVRDWDQSIAVSNVFRFGDAIAFRVVALMGLILAGVSVAGEHRWRTVVTQAAWTGERVRPLVARAAVYIGFVAIGLVVAHLSLVASSVGVALARGTLAKGELGSWLLTDGAAVTVRSLLPAAVYVVLAVAFATWTRSAAAGVAIPLAVLLLEPLGAALLASGDSLGSVANLTLSRNIDALLAANGPILGIRSAIPEGLPTPYAGALFLAIFCGATLALAMRSVARRDIFD